MRLNVDLLLHFEIFHFQLRSLIDIALTRYFIEHRGFERLIEGHLLSVMIVIVDEVLVVEPELLGFTLRGEKQVRMAMPWR